MPPKKAGGGGPSKKAENKAKERVIEDKTFGLKNKKGNKQQKFIQQVEKQVKSGGNPDHRKAELERLAAKKKKEEDQRKDEEMKALFKPVQTQKVESGVDPKSIFCAFFKQGLCKKGDRCKFSHDPECERKAAKKNLYADDREDQDNMDDWDEDKLNEVINKKHGTEKTNETKIICKHFLDAVENSKYGWFWECPNGGKSCMYKHALPPGFVLKKDKKREDENKETISIEDLIEKERTALSSNNLTKVTIHTFIAWKKKKLKEKQMEERKEADKKKNDMRAGKMGGLSGREMFSFDPNLVGEAEDDDEGEEFDFSGMEKEEGDEDVGVKVHEIKFDEFGIMDDGLDDSTATQLAAAAVGVDAGAAATATVIDEDLFDDEDLDELEEDLDKLDI